MLILVAAALVVGVLIGVGLYLYRSYQTQAGGVSSYEEAVSTGGAPEVSVTNATGRVIVTGEAGAEEVSIQARRYARGPDIAAAEQRAAETPVYLEREGDILRIDSGGGNTGVDYEVAVPAGSTLRIETGSGPVEVRGVLGDVSASTEAGAVTVTGSQGAVTAETAAGDVLVEDVTTETGRLSVLAEAGNVELRDLSLGTLEVEVGVGDVELAGRIRGSGDISVEQGNVEVGVPQEDSAGLDLQVGLGEVMRVQASGDEGSGGGVSAEEEDVQP